jgi:flotillin
LHLHKRKKNMVMEPLYLAIGIGVLLVFSLLIMMAKFYHKVEQGQALIINKLGAEPEISTNGGMVIPIIHKKEIMDISTKRMMLERKGRSGLICQDNIRADITITFYIRVNETKEDILRVAKQVGCERSSFPETLQELFEAKFSEALKTVGKQLNFTDLFTQRDIFRDKIKEVIGQDLSGYVLEDVAIDFLEQTSINDLDPNNIMDAEGIRRITELTAQQSVETNDLKRQEEIRIKRQDIDAKEKGLELDRQLADAQAKQTREISTVEAREEAETAKIVQEEFCKSEQARIATEQTVAVAEENKQREADIAQQNRFRAVAIEEEKVKRARQVEEIDREKEVETLRIDKEKALEIERKNIAEVQRERIMVEKGVAEEEELIKDLRVVSEANRQKDELVIKAKGEAEQALVKDIESAKAQEQAAEHIARKMQTIADAELKAASKQAESKKILAEGNQAEAASQGLAEAQITLAQADAHERQGEAEAKTLELKLTAEAKGIQEKALAEATGLREKQDVLNAMSEQAREFETFGLRLNQERELTLAKLENSVALAEKQAGVLATALSEANINIMGGDGEFLRQFMNSITVGKSIDGLVNESETVKTLFKDHLNGDRNIMDDLGGVLAGAAQTSETMKNFNMSKLLSTLNNADDTQKGALASLLNLANKNSSDEK